MKRFDVVIISVVCLFLGVFIVSQVYAAKNLKKITLPQNNEVLALEVAKLTRSNADLRLEVKKLTADFDAYKDTNRTQKELYDKYRSDSDRFDLANGAIKKQGQGVFVSVEGQLSTPELIDFINAVKNIGSDLISINGQRILINSDMALFAGLKHYEIIVLGNSSMLKNAMERKGGIVETISTKDIKFQISERENLEIPAGQPIIFNFARIIY